MTDILTPASAVGLSCTFAAPVGGKTISSVYCDQFLLYEFYRFYIFRIEAGLGFSA